MAPPRQPPELIDDAIAEILLRLPPGEPQCLFRASLVCKPWRRILTDAAFLRRYRRFHRAPPLLGLFFTVRLRGVQAFSCFVRTTVPFPFPKTMLNCPTWLTIDCRHGLVLLQNMEGGGGFIVWDPITGGRRELDQPRILDQYQGSSAAVLCAAPRCEHRDCHGRPFLVVWVCSVVNSVQGSAHVCVYSSQLGSWGTSVSVPIAGIDFVNPSRGAFGRDGVYFMLGVGARILKYDLVKHRLSVIDPPESYKKGIFVMPTEDGSLGIAGIKGTNLCLWSRKLNAKGVEGWIKYRVIKLQTLFPDDKLLHAAFVIGFAEGVRGIFVCTPSVISMIDLNTEQVRTVSKPERHYPAVPFTSFYTPDCACGKLPLPAETN